MKLLYERIRDLINNLNPVFGSFKYEGLEHLIIEQKRFDLSFPAWYTFPSSLVNGVQINVSSWVDPKFTKPIVLHEFLEWLIREKFRAKDGRYFYKKGSRKIAHNLASKFDEMYAKELFDEFTLKEYMKLKGSI